jgi:hypothetical protein
LAVWAPAIHLERGRFMSWDLIQVLLQQYGLPTVGLLAVSWAWYRERQANADLNAEVRANSCEMTAALVSVKDVAESFKDSLCAIDQRLQNCDKHLDELTEKTRGELSSRLETIEKRLIEIAAGKNK